MDEKILQSEVLSDEELDKVAGGALRRMYELYQNTDTASNLLSNSEVSGWTKIR